MLKDNDIMLFGRYKGESLENVPSYWLLWIYKRMKDEGVKNEYQSELLDYIEENLEAIQKNNGAYVSNSEQKRKGFIVETKTGLKGMVYYDEPHGNGKIVVIINKNILNDEARKRTDSHKMLCDPKTLKIIGYVD